MPIVNRSWHSDSIKYYVSVQSITLQIETDSSLYIRKRLRNNILFKNIITCGEPRYFP